MTWLAGIILTVGALLFQALPAGAQDTPLRRATPPPATPSPITASPPAWTPRSHAHYLAAAYGSHVALFAPGHTAPSTVLTLDGCCAAGAAFDASGDLFVVTTRAGLMTFPAGATSPVRRIATNGVTLAIDSAGDVAVAGVTDDKNVHVYPGGVEAGAYVIPAYAKTGGIAFAPNGDLAVADWGVQTVTVYAKRTTSATRSIAVPFGTNLVTFDPDGHLVAANTGNGVVTLFAPRSGIEREQINGILPFALAYDSAGRLLIGSVNGIWPFRPNVQPDRTLYGPSVFALATDSNGVFAAADFWDGRVLVFNGDTRTVIAGLENVRAVAFSP